jgi:hypothetical protein
MLRNASAFISSASKRALRLPHPTISQYQQLKQNHIPVKPPANMANPWLGRDVAARLPLTALRTAVVQRPLVASKMSTALLQTPGAAQRISVHLQRVKARLLPTNTRPPTPASHHLPISTTQTKLHTYQDKALTDRLRIWPILGSVVTSLQDCLLPS